MLAVIVSHSIPLSRMSHSLPSPPLPSSPAISSLLLSPPILSSPVLPSPQRLVSEHVVGVVGPACSEAVAGANRVFNLHRTPFVSFAATADKFARAQFDTFFRTV